MRKIFIVFIVLSSILSVVIYTIIIYRNELMSIQALNSQYEDYANIEVLGTELISIINKTIDINNKNEIEKDSNGYYIDNGKNTIRIYISFVYKNKTKVIQMEDIDKNGSESFVKIYSTAIFKCTNIEHYKGTNNIKSLTFEEMIQNI